MSAPDEEPLDVATRRRVVRTFLGRCRTWGTEREIPRTLDRLAQDATPSDAARLHQWTTWVAFLDHALGELDRGDLDPWLADEPPESVSPQSPSAGAVGAPRSSG
jgi:hypothetical protein